MLFKKDLKFSNILFPVLFLFLFIEFIFSVFGINFFYSYSIFLFFLFSFFILKFIDENNEFVGSWDIDEKSSSYGLPKQGNILFLKNDNLEMIKFKIVNYAYDLLGNKPIDKVLLCNVKKI